jgi:hypothetical protein
MPWKRSMAANLVWLHARRCELFCFNHGEAGAPKQPGHFAGRKIRAQIEGQTNNDLSIKENG